MQIPAESRNAPRGRQLLQRLALEGGLCPQRHGNCRSQAGKKNYQQNGDNSAALLAELDQLTLFNNLSQRPAGNKIIAGSVI